MPTLALPRLDQPTDYGTSTGKLDRIQWKAGLSLVSYGVRIGIRVSESTVLEQLQDYLPPGWEQSSSPDVDELYSLVVSESPDGYQLYRGQEELLQSLDLEPTFRALVVEIKSCSSPCIVRLLAITKNYEVSHSSQRSPA